MWPAAGTPYGSFYFNNEPNQLDQFLVNVNMIHPSGPLHVNPDTVEVLRLPGTVDPGTYPKPRPFGGMGHDIDQTGFSDHFPIGVRVTETPKSVSPSRGRRLRAWADSRLGQEPLQESRAYQAVCSFTGTEHWDLKRVVKGVDGIGLGTSDGALRSACAQMRRTR
jgi:hypothetical protein